MPNLFPTRYIAFDIETAKVLPEGASEILAYRPLGISCAAASLSDTGETLAWHGWTSSGDPAPRMSETEAGGMIDDLERYVDDGYTLVTWNGAGFDFDIVAEESGRRAECVELAMNHVDMLFHALCVLGHPISLQKAAEGMEVAGKLAEMSGAEAPTAWAEGRYDDVLAYVTQDTMVTAELAVLCEDLKELAWITRRDYRHTMPLPGGWLTVKEAQDLPLPDTSWMSDPPKRERFTAWMDAVRGRRPVCRSRNRLRRRYLSPVARA